MDANAAIERAIELCGGTQAGLAERADLSQQYISKLLANKRIPSIEAAIAISRATGGQIRIRDLLPDVVEAVAEEIERDAVDPSAASTAPATETAS